MAVSLTSQSRCAYATPPRKYPQSPRKPARRHPHAPSPARGVAQALQNKGAPQEGVEGAWRCTGCKNVNFGTRDSCHRCSTPKPPQHILDERIWAIQSGSAPSAGGRYRANQFCSAEWEGDMYRARVIRHIAADGTYEVPST